MGKLRIVGRMSHGRWLWSRHPSEHQWAAFGAWLPSVVFPAAFLLACPVQVSGFILSGQVHWSRPGLREIGCLAFFWLLVATLQSWTLRRWLPRPARWGIATFVGGFCATGAYPLGGMLLVPLWADLFGVIPRPAGVVPYFIGVNRLHQLVFFAVQGMLFGGVLGAAQSFLVPSRWLHRVTFAAMSALAGALAFGSVWLAFANAVPSIDGWGRLLGRFYGIMLNTIGVTKLISPLAWIIYAVMAGILLKRAVVRWRHVEQDSLASRFD